MIFPVLEIEDIVQVGDQTRLSATKSFAGKDDEISKVEIQPEATESFIDVTGDKSADWFLDWQYTGASRSVTVKVRVTVGEDTSELSKTMQVLTAADDKLFSADTDLIGIEPDILKYTPVGRASFLNIHRTAQTKILEGLDEAGIVDNAGNKITKAAVVDVTEVRAWSRDLVLHLIYKALINSVDDVFTKKMEFYASEVEKRKARAVLRLDLNGDGELGKSELVQTQSMELFRR